MLLLTVSLALASDVPVPPVGGGGGPACFVDPANSRPWKPILLNPKDWPLVDAGNPGGGTLYVAAATLDANGDPIGCTELGAVPAYSVVTFDLGSLVGPLGFLCTGPCEILTDE